MNADELYTLLNDLPDDYVTAAAGTHRQSRRTLYLMIPALAACITLVIAAAVYPKLRMQQPERKDPAYTAVTTSVTDTVTAAETTAVTAGRTETRTVTQTAPGTVGRTEARTGTQTAAVTVGSAEAQTVAQTAAVTASAAPAEQPAAAEQVRQEDTQQEVRETEPVQNAEEAEPVTTRHVIPASVTQTTAAAQTGTEQPEENPGGFFAVPTQTVPFRMRTERTSLTQENPSPAEQPGGPESPCTESPTACTTRSTELPTVPETMSTECPTPAVTTTAQPELSEEPQQDLTVKTDGSRITVTPMKPYANATLIKGSIGDDGTLNLTLLCLTGDVRQDETVQVILELPQKYSTAISDIKTEIVETDSPNAFEEVLNRSPVIYNRMKKEDHL